MFYLSFFFLSRDFIREIYTQRDIKRERGLFVVYIQSVVTATDTRYDTHVTSASDFDRSLDSPRSNSRCKRNPLTNGSGARWTPPETRSFLIFWCSSVLSWQWYILDGWSTSAPYRPVRGGCRSSAICAPWRATWCIYGTVSWPKSTAPYSASASAISWSSFSAIIALYAMRFDARTSPADRTPSSPTSSTDMVSVERSRFR